MRSRREITLPETIARAETTLQKPNETIKKTENDGRFVELGMVSGQGTDNDNF